MKSAQPTNRPKSVLCVFYTFFPSKKGIFIESRCGLGSASLSTSHLGWNQVQDRVLDFCQVSTHIEKTWFRFEFHPLLFVLAVDSQATSLSIPTWDRQGKIVVIWRVFHFIVILRGFHLDWKVNTSLKKVLFSCEKKALRHFYLRIKQDGALHL